MQVSKTATKRFRGIPQELLPCNSSGHRQRDRFVIVEAGPRNLADCPFDFRNPFPLLADAAVKTLPPNGPQTIPEQWPVGGDDPDVFNYYCNDNAAIGLPGGPHCALVDIHGTLRAFSGAWAFGLGEDAVPPSVRVRRLRKGWIPIVEAGCATGTFRARFSWFTTEIAETSPIAYPLPGNGSYQWVGAPNPSGRNLFHRIRCEIDNTEAASRPFDLHLGYAQSGALCSGAFYASPQHAPAWDRVWWQRREPDTTLLLARHGKDSLCLAILSHGGWRFRRTGNEIRHWPTPVPKAPARPAVTGAVLRQGIPAGDRAEVGLWVPEFPVPLDDLSVLLEADAAVLERRTEQAWRNRHARRPLFVIPETKVDHSFRQALNHLDMLSVAVGATEYPTPGPNGGHHIFYDRDASDMIHAYDVVGEHARAERMLDHYWLRHLGQEESGMILWQLGKHYDLTRDREWARRMFPMVTRCMTSLIRLWTDHQADNGGLLPPAALGDNELARGHYVSYHLYAAAGARAGARLATLLHEEPQAADWSAFAAMFDGIVIRRLRALGQATGGLITPTFEGFDAPPMTVDMFWEVPPRKHTYAGAFGANGGCDWHNLAAVFPTGVLSPHDPLITSSVARWRHMYVEGAFPYAQDSDYARVHNYNGMNLSGAWLRRNDWAETVRDLYGALLHTSATHASGEIVNSATRADYNCTPHNWFSGKLVRFIRDLLVYEDDQGRLHLLGGLAPAWMRTGLAVGVQEAPTEYGKLTYSARMRDGGMDMTIEWDARADARGLVLHLPPFLKRPKVLADGRRIRCVAGTWSLPKATRAVDVTWTPCSLPDISFRRIVECYLRDHAARDKG